MRHYEAYIESQDGEMWGASMGRPHPEDARLGALTQLAQRMASEKAYKPKRLIIFECTHFDEEELGDGSRGELD